jgi:hypothetical protein
MVGRLIQNIGSITGYFSLLHSHYVTAEINVDCLPMKAYVVHKARQDVGCLQDEHQAPANT